MLLRGQRVLQFSQSLVCTSDLLLCSLHGKKVARPTSQGQFAGFLGARRQEHLCLCGGRSGAQLLLFGAIVQGLMSDVSLCTTGTKPRRISDAQLSYNVIPKGDLRRLSAMSSCSQQLIPNSVCQIQQHDLLEVIFLCGGSSIVRGESVQLQAS